MAFLAGLPRYWVSIALPGTVQPSPFATYVSYRFEALPSAPGDVRAIAWLEQAAAHPEDYLASRFADAAQRDLSWSGVSELWPDTESLPNDFVHLLGDRGPGLRNRLRSATDCYFDLGDSVVEVEGGRLLHLISDSQWVFHWLLYVGDDAASAVVGSRFPAGFDLGPDDLESVGEEFPSYVVVANSFAEFAWRWWMDNEIFYKVEVDHVPLSQYETEYTRQYGPPAQP